MDAYKKTIAVEEAKVLLKNPTFRWRKMLSVFLWGSFIRLPVNTKNAVGNVTPACRQPGSRRFLRRLLTLDSAPDRVRGDDLRAGMTVQKRKGHSDGGTDSTEFFGLIRVQLV